MQHSDPSARNIHEAPSTPAFMRIGGPIVRPLPVEATQVTVRRFWLVQPWVIVAIVIAIMLALCIPGLLMELNRDF